MAGFIEFSLDYYRNRITHYENDVLNADDLYEARQLLKMIDDVVDEGYTKLFNRLEDEKLVTRLKCILEKYNIKPFELPKRIESIGVYGAKEYELNDYLDNIIADSTTCNEISDNLFLKDMKSFCDWIGYDENTAYIFLLRDTMLPYIYFKNNGRENIYPWLIGRKFLEIVADEEGIDDDLRYPIYNAAAEKVHSYREFIDYCKPDIMETLNDYPEIKKSVYKLLSDIKQDRIVVVESGCYGTFPVMLACMDERVDIRMFTAVPYLWDLYENHIYTKAYEKNRDFETLYSQDVLLKLADFRDEKFFVTVNDNKEVYQKALGEIKYFGDWR